jgi:hypothetical protein
MTEAEVKTMCKKMGVYFDEEHPDHINASNTIVPPFMEYFLVDMPVNADSRRYLDIKEMTIRIYSDTEVSESEKRIQEVLEEEDLRWKRSCEFIEELLLFAIQYKMEV